MNYMNNLPYMPTEIWDKIFDIKYSLEDREDMKKHNDYHKPLLKEFNKMFKSFNDDHYEYELQEISLSNKGINNFILHEFKNGKYARLLRPSIKLESWFLTKLIFDWCDFYNDMRRNF